MLKQIPYPILSQFTVKVENGGSLEEDLDRGDVLLVRVVLLGQLGEDVRFSTIDSFVSSHFCC